MQTLLRPWHSLTRSPLRRAFTCISTVHPKLRSRMSSRRSAGAVIARKGPRSVASVPMSRFISATHSRVPSTACQG